MSTTCNPFEDARIFARLQVGDRAEQSLAQDNKKEEHGSVFLLLFQFLKTVGC